MIKAEIKAETSPEVKSDSQVKTLIKTLAWLVVLLFIPQICIALLIGTFVALQPSVGSDPSTSIQIVMSLLISIISPLISLPILYKISGKKNVRECLEFLGIKSVNSKGLIKYSMLAILFWLCLSMLAYFFDLPVEQFIVEIKDAITEPFILLLVIASICFVGPIMEELIFRGWLFTRIAGTRLGNAGALLLSSVIFTFVHVQYDHVITMVGLFLFGLLLGFIRYKSNNVSYAILIHVIFNCLSIAILFFT